ESIAYNFLDKDCVVCAVMDARCNQVYTALFECINGEIQRLCEDKAIPIDELAEEISKINSTVYLAGDGAEIFFNASKDKLSNIKLSSENRRFQRAYGTALAAEKNKTFIDSSLLAPFYLRLPQAERELKLKKGE
ncbi:MAG: tRNA (adenosine(37)-N6)-threonylcarbamoyltransferase complex dimerization subunit type 1 TsaB, partial [Clostridia bacterium]|nr:tRNA (adenosine(37)-N6)-threonylcarbamoyltransferase complex dimerization subunit type 1 TsaB [Clostridia bacterium]